MLFQAYSDLYLKFRNKYPNIYIVFISMIVTIWFQGMFRIINRAFPNNFKTNMYMMIIPALILYFGDGRLEEIYNFEAVQKRLGALQNMDSGYRKGTTDAVLNY